MVIADGGIAAWFAEDNSQSALDEGRQGAHGLFGLLGGLVQEAFGDERPATADARGNRHVQPAAKANSATAIGIAGS